MHRFLVVGVAALAALALSAPAGAWTWPADGTVLRPFALGSDPYAGGQHRGIDVAGPEGAAIRAPAAGTVTFAGSLPTYGRGVTIQTADGFAITLVHLGAIAVEKGASVDEGSSIGTMGWSGMPEHAVPSVHLGIRRASDADAYVDPLGLLPPRAAPVPAPTPAPAPAPTPAPAAPPGASPHPQPDAPGPSTAPAPAPPPTSTPAGPEQPAANAATLQPTNVPTAGSSPATSADPTSTEPGRGAPRGQPGLTMSATNVPHRRPPAAIDPGRSRPDVTEARSAVPGDAAPAAAARGESVPVGAAKAMATGPGEISVPGRASPAASDSPTRTGHERRWASGGLGSLDPTARTGPGAVAVHRPTRRAAIATGGATRAIRDGGAPVGPLVAAFLLGCLLAAAGIRRGARRIDGNGAVLPHDADLLRELDPAHRARVHDRGRGRLRPPPAAARS